MSAKIRDIKNLVFGRLTVIEQTGQRGANGGVRWLCQCECGKTTIAASGDLIKNSVLSCGCYLSEMNGSKRWWNWNGVGEISGSLFNQYYQRAKRDSIEFCITKDYLWDIFLNQNRKCKFSGIELTFPSRDRKKHLATASLDRIDSSKGYIEGNVQWVHKHINFMKLQMPDDLFIEWCAIITDYNKDKMALKKPIEYNNE